MGSVPADAQSRVREVSLLTCKEPRSPGAPVLSPSRPSGHSSRAAGCRRRRESCVSLRKPSGDPFLFLASPWSPTLMPAPGRWPLCLRPAPYSTTPAHGAQFQLPVLGLGCPLCSPLEPQVHFLPSFRPEPRPPQLRSNVAPSCLGFGGTSSAALGLWSLQHTAPTSLRSLSDSSHIAPMQDIFHPSL